jgi:heterodisulfide reductase subunit C
MNFAAKRPNRLDATVPDREALNAISEKIKSCIQCGTCTASCPNEFAMDLTPRRLWRLVLMGETEAIFTSRTFTLCSACYSCTLRCPRGLPLTDAMLDLKQMAYRGRMTRYKPSTAFYGHFMDTIRRHGRIRETEFISRYFLTMTPSKPLLPLSYSGLGFKLLRKGKMAIEYPFAAPGKRSLENIFKKVESMEASA